MRALAVLALLPLPASLQEEDRVAFDQVTEDFERRWAAAWEALDWKALFDLHAYAAEHAAGRLAQPDPEDPRWLPLPRVLAARLAAMPDATREPYELVTRQLLETAPRPEDRERLLEKYGFTRAAFEERAASAARNYDAGRVAEALAEWTRALETRFSPEIAARLARAHAAREDRLGLDALRARAAREGWEGVLRVAGLRRDLREYLESLRVPDPAPANEGPPPTPEIALGRYALPESVPSLGRRRAFAAPAHTLRAGAEYVLVGDGLTVVALDPAFAGCGDASAGRPAAMLRWRYPREGARRSYRPLVYGDPAPLPGLTADGDRVYATMYSVHSRQGQIGRRVDRFEGPAALRALALETGELLWDTDAPESSLEDLLPDARLNFWFAGAPVVRGRRLYAALVTHAPQRQCMMLCLEAPTGRPLWCTRVASAPPGRGPLAVPAFDEREGTLVVSTGFGAVAALDAATGRIEWLVKYPRQPDARTAVNAPLLTPSAALVLAQDAEELMAFDRWTGRRLDLPRQASMDWPRVQYLLGAAGEWVVLGGWKNYAWRLADGQVVELDEAGESPRPARGTVAAGVAYIPGSSGLRLYEAGSWRSRGTLPWADLSAEASAKADADDAAHLRIAGGLFLLMTDRLLVATSLEGLRARFAARTDVDPPRPDACRRLAEILEAAGRAGEACYYYRRALAFAAGDDEAAALRAKLEEMASRGIEPVPPPYRPSSER
jgi:outer membrane protein assembly factor BamB